MMMSIRPLPAPVAAFVRFAISGGGIAFIAVATYYVCAMPLHLPPLLANLIAYLVQLVIGYQVHRIYSFGQVRMDRAGMARYLLLSLSALAMNSLWVWGLTDLAGFARWTPIVPMVAVTPIITFLVARHWVFVPRPAAV